MNKYLCPICNKRACDSSKNIQLIKLSDFNQTTADIIIKCKCCKNTLAVIIEK